MACYGSVEHYHQYTVERAVDGTGCLEHRRTLVGTLKGAGFSCYTTKRWAAGGEHTKGSHLHYCDESSLGAYCHRSSTMIRSALERSVSKHICQKWPNIQWPGNLFLLGLRSKGNQGNKENHFIIVNNTKTHRPTIKSRLGMQAKHPARDRRRTMRREEPRKAT